MGLDISRSADLPPNINADYDYVRSTWTPERILATPCSRLQKEGESALTARTLRIAAGELAAYFGERRPSVLEVFAGSGAASAIIRERWPTGYWLATDAVDYDQYYTDVPFEQVNAHDAVIEYGSGADVLLMISPPPYSSIYKDVADGESAGYSDYFACRDFILTGRGHIVFIGELGGNDGSTGMYKYLMHHEHLVLDHHYTLHACEDMLGGSCEKDLFIFKITKSVTIA